MTPFTEASFVIFFALFEIILLRWGLKILKANP